MKTERAFAYMKRTIELDKADRDGLLAASRYYALTNARKRRFADVGEGQHHPRQQRRIQLFAWEVEAIG